MREVALAQLRCTVTHDPDGAPRLLDRDGHISISHDGAWTVAAYSDEPIGIDLCLRSHAARATRILDWLAIDCEADPVEQFAALEAALKLRRLGIERVLDRDLAITVDGDALVVHGLGDEIRATLHHYPDFVMAVCG